MSENYLLAKQLLNEGKFEDALEILEQELETTKSMLATSSSSSSSSSFLGHKQKTQNNNNNIMNTDVHPALAPLHYLYGTTLLYSLEEAKDDNGQDMATMTTAILPQDVDDNDPSNSVSNHNNNNPCAHLPESSSPFLAEPATVVSDDAEDMEIAWENFEVARHIIETMISSQPPFGVTMQTKLKLYVGYDGQITFVDD
jgi:hypothetical protein